MSSTTLSAPIAQDADAAEPAPIVTPPDDVELYSYLGGQARWVQLVAVVGYLIAAYSLCMFALTSPLLYPLLAVLAIGLSSSLLSLVTGLGKRTVSRSTHIALVNSWHRATPVEQLPSVDVFLPSCGEDIAVLRNTYTWVQKLDWQGELNVWVMDDADKREVEQAAAEFGFHYIVRPNRGYMKKAGNLHYASTQTSGDFIVILDADFCPRADFLHHTIPYMSDGKTAIVQTPQYFETRDDMGWVERTAGATQELFYRWVQPARDRVGAAICVGTCAVYRRAALDAAGGFAQIEHSEDVHTGIKLTRAGFGLKYVPIVVSRGLCPDDLAGFMNQQYRWANGSMSLLKSGAASRRPLKPLQILSFWSGFLYYISTAVNVFFLHVPGLVMAVFFADQVRAAHYIPFLAGAWVYFVLMPRVMRSRWRFEVMRIQMAYSLCHALAVIHTITGRSAGWVATGAVGKGGGSSLASTISTIGIVLITLTFGGSWVAFGFDVAAYGWGEFWTMALFLSAYTYISLPLLVSLVRVRMAAAAKTRRAAAASRAPEPVSALGHVAVLETSLLNGPVA